MAMDKINGSPLPQQGILGNTRQNERVGNGSRNDGGVTGAPAPASQPLGGDTAQISDSAHRLMELRLAVDTGRAALELLPEIREEKVAQARERLNSGFYESAAVRDKVAGDIGGVIASMDNL